MEVLTLKFVRETLVYDQLNQSSFMEYFVVYYEEQGASAFNVCV